MVYKSVVILSFFLSEPVKNYQFFFLSLNLAILQKYERERSVTKPINSSGRRHIDHHFRESCPRFSSGSAHVELIKGSKIWICCIFVFVFFGAKFTVLVV